jgi:ribA/ribD-fused uncharacterized protein
VADIKFYRPFQEWGFLSNFYHSPFTLKGDWYRTVEHYFQSHKFLDPQIQLYIRGLSTPGAAAVEGRRRDLPLRPDWEGIKEVIMFEGLVAKFSQNRDLMVKLLETQPNNLIENSPIDWYWGVGRDGTGQNRLGVQLMHLRSYLVTRTS